MEGEVTKRRRKDQMVNLVVVCLLQSAAASLITAELFEVRGQRVCRVDRGRPCYKLAYFSDPGRRLSFLEAKLACRRDGGELLSVESPAEQRIIEQLVTELRPSDGDFWIGLRRNHGDTENVDDCPSQYYWTDGSHASFRNWHWDEPSCGYEVCVVMYHQPSAPPGLGGLYMFQWNDDNCDTKNNFICKYTAEKAPEPSPNTAHPEAPPLSLSPLPTTFDTEEKRQTPALVYMVLPTIPLLMVLLIATAVFCFKLLARRRKRREQQTEVCPSDPGSRPSQAQPPDVYNVIRSQQEADLAGTRPHTKNTSFLGSSPDMSPGDYDNMGGLRDTESGFVTLASTESNFLLTSELYDLSLGRRQDNSDIYRKSLDRQGNGEVYNNSLGRHGNRETSDNGLGCHGNGGTYNNRLVHGCVVKSSELYNTSHYRDSLYQTSLDRYGNPEHHERSLGRHGNDASVDCYGKEATVGYYGNEGSLGGKCYKEWLDSDSN
ncbi:layilin [Salvelinus fontinalis]|uniref:layilin n=1 Tax=Salvelinus fontinalis TaxID=8038 RepID=UPI002486AAF1|nr:layilin [Salvelinus fontinalis]